MEGSGHVTISLASIFQARNDLNLGMVLALEWNIQVP